MFTTASALAAVVDITARFLPDSSNPNINRFENTTPSTGFCGQYPYCCPNAFSISVPNRTDFTPMVKGQPISLSVPHSWQELQVTHIDGSSRTVKVRIVGLGARYQLSHPSSSIGGNHPSLWEGNSWEGHPVGGCRSSGLGTYTDYSFRFFWHFSSDSPCRKVALYDVTPGVYFTQIDFMYELQTPNPLEMAMGVYTGSHTYTLGRNGDFKLGDADAVGDSVIQLNFTLSVQHTLRVQFPVGATLVALQPQGGWQQWLINGEHLRPQKLLANQPYQLWSSTRFKMQLQCQHPIGEDCGLQSDAGNSVVPVKTRVSLPYNLRESSSNPVNHHLLSSTAASYFQPSSYVNNERATLHFEVESKGVEQMVNSGGGRYRGNVTVLWDSDV